MNSEDNKKPDSAVIRTTNAGQVYVDAVSQISVTISPPGLTVDNLGCNPGRRSSRYDYKPTW
jgi:hypothetical protein